MAVVSEDNMCEKHLIQNKINILLVDDTPSNLLALEVILEDPSYNLVSVTSGQEALNYLASNDVAVILTDVMMPIMDGFALAKKIKQDEKLKEVPIIFLTAMAKDGSQIFQGYHYGAVDYIQKPLNEDIVRAKVAVFAQLFCSKEMLRQQSKALKESYLAQYELNATLEDRVKKRTEELTTAIEELKISERRYANLYETAEKMNRIRDEFLAMLSHELRTPLNIIMGYAELIDKEDPYSEEFKEAIDAIKRNAKLQNNIIGELLDVSRIITGKMTLKNEVVDLENIITLTINSLKLAIQAKSLTLRTFFTPCSQKTIGDNSRLQQVVWNLLSNAIKFTQPGGQITVTLEELPSELMIEIADNGKGIESDFLPYVFERFRQEDASSTREHGGLGLGLAIVRHIVELHGGRVQVESEGKGRGAAFQCFLPLLGTTDNNNLVNNNNQIASNKYFLQGYRILVVDDQLDARLLVSKVLERTGAQVITAESANCALNYLENGHFDILICDIGMPENDGYCLIEQIRSLMSESKQIPAIALTAYASSVDRQRAEQAGFQLHLSKPINIKELVEAVTKLIF